MTRRNLNAVVRYLRQLTGSADGGGASDAELLERYVHHRDEAAFELLLWRHGTLVFNVCRRILPCEQDAEDAFQATFLAFVRKAHVIVRRGSVASWLYKVAYRVALAAKERAKKKAAHEKQTSETLTIKPIPEPIWAELRPILDEEVNRLPERLRRPFVLCYLEGKTNEEAAQQLDCPIGTIFSRLARGREMLRKRLLRRGVALSITGLTAALAEHAAGSVPAAALMTTTVHSALRFAVGQTIGGISPQVTTLAEGVLRAMFFSKIKLTALMFLVVGLFAAGGVFTRHVLNAASQPENDKDKPVVAEKRPAQHKQQRTSRYTGHVRAAAQQVYPAISGYLKRQRVDIGDRVKRGDVLAEIEAPLLEVEVKQARAAFALERKQVEVAKAQVDTALAEAKAASDRIKSLEAKLRSEEAYLAFRKKQAERYKGLLADRAIDDKLVAEQEDRLEAAREAVIANQGALRAAQADVSVRESKVQSAKAALEMATAKLEIARLVVEKAEAQLELTRLRASFDGVVVQRNFDVGEFLSVNDRGTRRPLLMVMRMDSLRVVVTVWEADVPFIRPDLAVEMHCKAYPNVQFPDCKVSRIGFSIDEGTGTMPVEIDVPNPKNLLRPGMDMTADIHLDKKAP